VVNVGLIDRVLTRGLDGMDGQPPAPVSPPSAATQFVSDSSDFALRRPS
jgi:hypothetical protein